MKKPILLAMALSASGAVAHAQDWNVDVFGGIALTNTLLWDTLSYDTNQGAVYGIGVSKSGVFTPNLEVGFELSHTQVEYNGFEPNSIAGLAAMVTAEYTVFSNNGFEAYGGVGLGAVNVTYTNSLSSYANSEVVAGGQAVLGLRYAVSDRIKLFTEARYIGTFTDPVVAYSPANRTAEFNATNIVFGVRASF